MTIPGTATHLGIEGRYVEKLHDSVGPIGRQRCVVYRDLTSPGTPICTMLEGSFYNHFIKIRQRIRVRQHVPGFVDIGGEPTCVYVGQPSEVESLEFIERWHSVPGFAGFRLGVKDGMECTLMAIVQEETKLAYYVTAFLFSEDYSKIDLLAQWRQWNTDNNGNLVD